MTCQIISLLCFTGWGGADGDGDVLLAIKFKNKDLESGVMKKSATSPSHLYLLFKNKLFTKHTVNTVKINTNIVKQLGYTKSNFSI